METRMIPRVPQKVRGFRTSNSEYYIIDSVCIAVKNNTTGHWVKDHIAISHRLVGSINMDNGDYALNLSDARTGESLCFSNGESSILTSPIIEVMPNVNPEPFLNC